VTVGVLRRGFAAAALPLDATRRRAIRATGSLGRTLVTRRELRVAVQGVLAAGTALVATAFLPLWGLALGPLILGVPHLLADLRYLVIRPGHHRDPAFLLAVGGPVAAYALLGGPALGFAAVAGAAAAAPGPGWRRALVGLGGLGLVAVGTAWPAACALAIAHLHNPIGVAAWAGWRRRETWLHWIPIAAFAVGMLWILAGGLDAVALPPLAGPDGVGMAAHARALAPGVPAPLAARVVLSFAFAQQVHYAVWLRLVPDDDQARATSRTFRRILADTVDDLGAPLVWLALATGLGLLIWAAFDTLGARLGYLDLVLFHGMLELGVLAWWLAGGRRG
jgi:hypothetical protein